MRYVSGEFSLDTERFELRRAGQTVPLQPKAFRILAYLIEHRDRVVTKEELFTQCWPGRVVGDAALNTAICSIRRALVGSGREGLIQTLHKHGYRFVGEVVESAGEPAAAPAVQTAVAASPPAEFAREYKQVSVLCCTLADADELAERLGPEDMDRRMRAFFALTDEVLEQYGGTLLQRLEDGFTAVFGAPLAQEDHTRRAVLAALELRRRVQQDRTGMALSMGVHGGPVVVGSLDDEPGRPYVAASETTRLARRLQQQAAPVELLISDAVHRILAGEIRTEPTGIVDPPAHRVVGITARRAGVPQRDACSPTPFVGRDRELALLQECLDQAREGRGRIVAISGEPGIGKSRLLREFRHDLEGIRCYQGHCLPYAAVASYLPVLELVRRICGIRGDDPPAAIADKVSAGLGRAGMDISEAAPLLLHLLDVPAHTATLARLSPQVQRERTLACLCDLALHAGPHEPHLLILEDLHWIDASSEEWLTRLTGKIAGVPVLLVLTYRPEYRPEWLESAPVTHLTLPPLTRRSSAELMRSTTHPLPDELVRDIAARAAGNPFFLEELTRTLETTGTASDIPDTVQGVLAARIDRLGATDKRLLQIAAVIGARVPLALWRAVGECSEEDIRQALERLQQGGFLHETRSTTGSACVFKHALTREVAYRSLLHSTRQGLHERTARLIAKHFADSVFGQPEALAYHYTEAGVHREAVACWRQAGRRAYERSAMPEAMMHHVPQGLDVLHEPPRGGPSDDDRARLELRLLPTQGPALMAARGHTDLQVRETWAKTRELCERPSERAALFEGLVRLWNHHWVQGQSGQAVGAARELLALAEIDREPVCLLRAHAALGGILFHTGRLREAGEHLEQGVAHYHALAHHSHAADAPGVACLCYSAWALWPLGHPEQALERIRQALELARSLEQPFSLAIALCLGAELYQFHLDEVTALEMAGEAVELCREQGLPFWEGTALILRGWALARTGRTDEGIAILHQGLKVFGSTDAKVQLSSWYSLLAEAHACAGEVELGLAAVAQALSWVDRTGERYYESEAQRLRGQLLRQNGDIESAEVAYRRALEIAHRQQAGIRELRAAVALAELWREQGRMAEARELLQPLHDGLAQGGDWPDLKRVEVYLH
jgi:DNA-binding winged helix-turn-helix (wHTH) protein/tetratricopeptide (TPR) repeat protein